MVKFIYTCSLCSLVLIGNPVLQCAPSGIVKGGEQKKRLGREFSLIEDHCDLYSLAVTLCPDVKKPTLQGRFISEYSND